MPYLDDSDTVENSLAWISDALGQMSQALTTSDANNEPLNITDVARANANAIEKLANSITPMSAMPGHDASGGVVTSLTEAIMGVSAGLHKIAEAINNVADTIATK